MPNVAETKFLKISTLSYLWNSKLLFHSHPHKANQMSHLKLSCLFLLFPGNSFCWGVLFIPCVNPAPVLVMSCPRAERVQRGACGRGQKELNPCQRCRWSIFLLLIATTLSHSVKTLILVQWDFIHTGVGAEELLERTHPLSSRLCSYF